jgi:hypothetical protein
MMVLMKVELLVMNVIKNVKLVTVIDLTVLPVLIIELIMHQLVAVLMVNSNQMNHVMIVTTNVLLVVMLGMIVLHVLIILDLQFQIVTVKPDTSMTVLMLLVQFVTKNVLNVLAIMKTVLYVPLKEF